MQKEKILVFGAHSLIGEDVCKELKAEFRLESHSRKDLDLNNMNEVEKLLAEREYDYILYAAGLTDPEACEDEKEKAFFLNGEVPSQMAAFAAKHRPESVFIYLSDVMVFDGTKSGPYTEADQPDPKSVYGQSKFQGEQGIMQATENYIIVRTSWVFGKKMKGIFKKLLEIYEKSPQLKVVNNYSGNPTYARDVGLGLAGLIKARFTGIAHLASEGCCSWYDYTYEFLNLSGAMAQGKKLVGMKSDGSHLKSTRPANSCLESQYDNTVLPYWKDSLKRYVAEVFKKSAENSD